MAASSFAAVSLDPPLLAVSVNKPDLMHQRLALTDGMYGVSILGHDQVDVADFFARLPWSEATDLAIDWRDGCPVIAGALGWFVCRKWATYDGGDHTIFVGESIQNGASDRSDLGPLLWHESDYHTLGSPLTRGGSRKPRMRTDRSSLIIGCPDHRSPLLDMEGGRRMRFPWDTARYGRIPGRER